MPTSQPSGQPTGAPTNLAESANTEIFANATVDLFSAARSGSIEAIETVIQAAAAAETDVRGSTGNKVAYSALVTAIFDDSTAVADVLVEKAAIPIDDAGVTGNTPLMWSAIFCKTNVMSSLLVKGASVTLTNKDGKTPLALAKNAGCASGAALLRKAGARK
jgi:ankyrin repeat protein